MDIKETQLDIETVESATNEISFYANIPKHIRGIVSEMKDIKSNLDMPKPAHVVNGAITVIGGKALNMLLNKSKYKLELTPIGDINSNLPYLW